MIWPHKKGLNLNFRDNDAIYGDEVRRFLKETGIEEVSTAFRSPWKNGLSTKGQCL
jgi:hypothetical protein